MKNIKSIEEFLFESKSSAKKRFLDRGLISDEVFNTFLEVDITPTKKFIEKMCEFFVAGSSEEEVIETFEKAISFSERQILSFDISLISSIQELQNLISTKENYQSRSEKKSGVEVVYEDSRFKVVRPKTEEEAILYGKDTEWCISALKDNQFNKYYHKQNLTIYIIIDKTLNDRSPYSKIAVLVDEYNNIHSTWDSTDKRVDFDDVMRKIDLSIIGIFKYYPNKPDVVIKLEDIVKGTWVINPDGEVDVKGDVNMSGMRLTKIPFEFSRVTGSFDCSKNHLISLEFAPSYIGGSFSCSKNHLTSLEFAPSKVGGSFYCSYNNLTNLKGSPSKIENGAFYCSNNLLTNLEGAPSKVGGDFMCHNNHLTSLKFAPYYVGGWFDCSKNHLTSLEFAPSKVGGGFWGGFQKNEHQFTEEYVREICEVGEDVGV